MGKEPSVRIDPIFGGRSPRRNHVIQIWWRSVKVFRVAWGSNFTLSCWLWWSPLQHTHTTVYNIIYNIVAPQQFLSRHARLASVCSCDTAWAWFPQLCGLGLSSSLTVTVGLQTLKIFSLLLMSVCHRLCPHMRRSKKKTKWSLSTAYKQNCFAKLSLSVILPVRCCCRLAHLFPSLVHVEIDTLIYPSAKELKLMFGPKAYNWSRQYSSHVWKDFHKIPNSPNDIVQLTSTVGQMMRHIYDGPRWQNSAGCAFPAHDRI